MTKLLVLFNISNYLTYISTTKVDNIIVYLFFEGNIIVYFTTKREKELIKVIAAGFFNCSYPFSFQIL